MNPPSIPPLAGAPQPSRRGFLRSATAAAAGAMACQPFMMSTRARAAAGVAAPSGRITVGLIGRGIMGSGHLKVLLGRGDTQVLAVCDVDRSRREEGCRIAEETYGAQSVSGTYRGCAAVNDYRELLARPDLDALLIATPDHWHSLISIEAARAGKDVYCEKPVSLTLHEGRELADTIRRYVRVFQTGTQYRSIPIIRQVCEFVRGGGLGKVSAVFTIWNKMNVPTVGPAMVPMDPPLPAEVPPDGLDWERWVGPARFRAYNSAYHRNPPPGVVPWTFCEAFGAGAVTNYHSHAADVIQYAIGMETSGPIDIIHPSSGEFPTLTCRYANGVLLHHVEHWGQVKSLYQAVPGDARLEGLFGGLFVGQRGWITSMSGSGPVEAGPKNLLEEMRLNSREVAIGTNTHHSDWFECIRSRRQPRAHAEIGHRSASLGHLVSLAYAQGRSLRWDPLREEFPGDAAANRQCARAMRVPWQI